MTSQDFERDYWRSTGELAERLPDLSPEVISDDQFRLLADNIPTLCWIANGDGYIVWYNRRWHEYCGTTPEQMEGWGWQSVHDPDVLPEVMERWQRSIATGEPFEMTFPLKGADGVFRPFLTRVQPVRDSTGKVARWFGVNTEITATIAAEAALRESEQRFRVLVDASAQIVWATDAQGRVVEDSPSWRAFTGQSVEQWLGNAWSEVMHPEDVDRVIVEWGNCVASGVDLNLDYRLRRADGEWRWVTARGAPLRNSDGTIRGWVGMIIDITDRRKAERLRIAQNRVLELAIQDRPIGETLEALVRAVEEQSAAGVIGSILLLDHDGVHLRHGAGPGLPDAYNQAIDGIAIGPKVGSCGTAAFTGERVFVSDIANDPLWADFRDLALEHGLRACWSIPIKSSAGNVLGTFAMYYREPREPIAEDLELVDFVIRSTAIVLERQAAETALRDETHTLETLNRTGVAIASELDLQRLVQRVTDAGVELTGAEFGAFFYNVLNEAGEAYMLYTLSGAKPSDFEAFPMPRNTEVFAPTFAGDGVVRSDDITTDPRYGKNKPYRGMPKGHLPVRSYLAVPVASHSGEVIGGLFFGHAEPGRFTERHEQLLIGIAAQAAIGIDNARLYQAVQRANETLEQRVEQRTAELELANEALRQAQKMEAIGQLTGGIAHDFNNMLTVIRGAADVLQRPDLADAKRQRYIEAIAETASRAARLTGQLLAFARRQALKPEVFDARRRVESIGEMLRPLLGSRIRVEIEGGEKECFVEADATQFETALVNMAVNARDAMDGEGRLSIRLKTVDRLPRALAGQGGEGPFVAISVTDTGHGIDPADLPKIFEPFFTRKEVGKGTGLGLSQVYGFAKQSGGEVEVASVPGEGSTFTLYLPNTDRPVEQVRKSPAAAARPRSGARVLIVEDHDDVGRFAEEVLLELGYKASRASSADEALERLESGEQFDLVFCDVVMPGKSGIELGHEIRERWPDLPVVLTSGYSHVLASESGHGFPLVQKPYSLDALGMALEKALPGED